MFFLQSKKNQNKKRNLKFSFYGHKVKFGLQNRRNICIFRAQNFRRMKQLRTHINLIIIAIIALNYSCNSEADVVTSDSAAVILKSKTFKPGDFSIPKKLNYCTETEEILIETFFPIGISNDGFFAYLTEPADEATGFYFMNFVIMNTETGESVWTFKIDENNALENTVLSEIWMKHRDIFNSKLNDYQIIEFANPVLKLLPSNKPAFDIRAELNYVESKSGLGIQVIDNVNFEVIQKKSDTKIGSLKFTDDMTINVTVHGCLPIGENRYLLLVTDERIGYEGPPNVLTLKILPFKLQK